MTLLADRSMTETLATPVWGAAMVACMATTWPGVKLWMVEEVASSNWLRWPR